MLVSLICVFVVVVLGCDYVVELLGFVDCDGCGAQVVVGCGVGGWCVGDCLLEVVFVVVWFVYCGGWVVVWVW